jgi:hypothetical protein
MHEVIEQASSFEALFAAAVGLDEVVSLSAEDPDGHGDITEIPESVEESIEHDAPASVGEHYKALWLRYRKGLEAWSHEQCSIRSVERNLVDRNVGKYMRAFDEVCEIDTRRILSSRASEIRKMLIWMAEKLFAPHGVTLKIDGYEVFERFPCERDDIESFDPVAIWTYLENKYGGSFGAKLAWQQVAKGFKSKFNLDRDEEVVVKGGYIILDKRIWIDDFDKKYHKKNRLTYSCCESLSQAINVLSEIARWSERHVLSSDLLRMASKFNDRGYEIESRERLAAGKDGEVVVVTYTSRFEFRVRQDFAEEIQVFLGSFLEVEP